MTDILISLFIKKKDQIEDAQVRNSYGILGGSVGICCNILLFVGKLFAGMATGAISITADAFNNLSDAASSIITLIGFGIAGKPADEDHPFGHGRMEYISGFIVSLAILVMGVELLKSSVEKILHPEDITFQAVSVVILAISILIKLWMAVFNRKIGNKIQSETMKATATDSLNDCISTAAVLAGMLVFRFWGYNLDGGIGIVVACFVLWGGYGAAKDTLDPLLGETPDPALVKNIEGMVLNHKMVIGVHDMMIHDYGPGRRIVSLHAEVPYTVDIMEAHDMIDHIEMRLMEEYQCEATIHMDPVVTDDEQTTKTKKMVEGLVREYDPVLSIHDFRMVTGKTHTNVIFDLVIPYGKQYQVKQIVKELREKIHREMPEEFFAVIRVDRSHVVERRH